MAPTFNLKRPLAAIPTYSFIIITLAVVLTLVIGFRLEAGGANTYARAYEINTWQGSTSVARNASGRRTLAENKRTGLQKAGEEDEGKIKVFGIEGFTPIKAKLAQRWLLLIILVLIHLSLICMAYQKDGKAKK